jgi:hypothetical protein
MWRKVMDCGPKSGLNPNHFLMAPQSRVYMASYLRAARGCPKHYGLVQSPRRQLMKIELVVETSTHSINGRHGRPDRGD